MKRKTEELLIGIVRMKIAKSWVLLFDRYQIPTMEEKKGKIDKIAIQMPMIVERELLMMLMVCWAMGTVDL